MQTDVATFRLPRETGARSFTATAKEGDNYGDSSLQFVFGAQLISREREREGEI